MSDIRFKYAQIGGGKSLHSVIEICEELERSDRYVVTNISILLDDSPSGYQTFREYCQKWIDKPVDISRRVAWLTKEQALQFYRYLPAGAVTKEQIEQFGLVIHENVFERDGVVLSRCKVAELPLRDDVVSGKLVDFAARNHSTGCFAHGCHYFIDEVHKLFSARQYHKVSPMLEDYQSELRKLDDDLTMITQHPEKVDKNCRRNATEWMIVQNMAKSRLFLGVRIQNKFRYHWFNQAEMPGKADKPTVSGWYHFDGKRRYHQLYLTMDGVGVSGGMVKETNRQRGRHWSVWLLALVVICVFSWYLPRIVGGIGNHFIGKTVGSALAGVSSGMAGELKKNSFSTPSFPAPAPAQPNVHTNRAVRRTDLPAPVPNTQPVASTLAVKQYSRVNGDMWVWLTDGRIAKASRGEVEKVGENYCLVLGQKLPVLP